MGHESGGGSIESLAVYFVRRLLTKFIGFGQQLSSRCVLRAAGLRQQLRFAGWTSYHCLQSSATIGSTTG